MSSTRIPAVVAVLFALGTVAVSALLRSSDEQDGPAALTRGGGALECGAKQDSVPLELDATPGAALERSAEEREIAATAAGALEVQVVLPVGAPADPKVQVVAVDASTLGADSPSAFLESLRANTAREPVYLLDGRYLFLREPARHPDSAATLRLEPELGAAPPSPVGWSTMPDADWRGSRSASTTPNPGWAAVRRATRGRRAARRGAPRLEPRPLDHGRRPERGWPSKRAARTRLGVAGLDRA